MITYKYTRFLFLFFLVFAVFFPFTLIFRPHFSTPSLYCIPSFLSSHYLTFTCSSFLCYPLFLVFLLSSSFIIFLSFLFRPTFFFSACHYLTPTYCSFLCYPLLLVFLLSFSFIIFLSYVNYHLQIHSLFFLLFLSFAFFSPFTPLSRSYTPLQEQP